MTGVTKSSGIKIVSENRKAHFEYFILEKFEAGLVLMGSEVKSMRAGSCQLKDSFIELRNDEAYLMKAHIAPYKSGGHSNHEPERTRKLLLKEEEISKLSSKVRERGLTIIPLKVYFKNSLAKIEIALVKGKKTHDKRESLKEKDLRRDSERNDY